MEFGLPLEACLYEKSFADKYFLWQTEFHATQFLDDRLFSNKLFLLLWWYFLCWWFLKRVTPTRCQLNFKRTFIFWWNYVWIIHKRYYHNKAVNDIETWTSKSITYILFCRNKRFVCVHKYNEGEILVALGFENKPSSFYPQIISFVKNSACQRLRVPYVFLTKTSYTRWTASKWR